MSIGTPLALLDDLRRWQLLSPAQLETVCAELGQLTDPQRLAEWLAPGTIALEPGGAAKLNFTDSGTVIDSTVTAMTSGVG